MGNKISEKFVLKNQSSFVLIFTEYLTNNILPHYPSNELLMEQTRLFFDQNKIVLFKKK